MNNLINLIKKYNLIQNPDGSFDCNGDVCVENDLVKDGKLIIKFNNVTYSFVCMDNNLTTLEGAPIIVGCGFYCQNNNLISLHGAPKVVGRYYDFYCYNNPSLTSLKGLPKIIGGELRCDKHLVNTSEYKKYLTMKKLKGL